ncbi:hypothetical protein F511_33432 [Dorcoceras hygrometricum]|uniref:Uncharacterized protein n=1 Tax=Dorcoceras hygrometricum TaxID=472368 RepID=A0A2Z7D1I9_9LAMI|nr:hypothetical protein F511_33432 [Dorcoceras hygrometricum]
MMNSRRICPADGSQNKDSAAGLVFMESAAGLAMETSKVESAVRNLAKAKLNQLEHNCGRNRQSGPRPEPRLLCQPALEAMTNSARTDSPRRIGRNEFRRLEAAAAAAAVCVERRGGGYFVSRVRLYQVMS